VDGSTTPWALWCQLVNRLVARGLSRDAAIEIGRQLEPAMWANLQETISTLERRGRLRAELRRRAEALTAEARAEAEREQAEQRAKGRRIYRQNRERTRD